jgi:hypothetical protein
MIALAAIFFSGAILLTGCGVKKVAGKTYVNEDGDSFEFRSDGKAIETNWDPMVVYPGQETMLGTIPLINTTGRDFKIGSGKAAGTECSYIQNRDQVSVSCARGVKITYVLDSEGSLTGPPEGIWGHAVFSRLKLKE